MTNLRITAGADSHSLSISSYVTVRTFTFLYCPLPRPECVAFSKEESVHFIYTKPIMMSLDNNSVLALEGGGVRAVWSAPYLATAGAPAGPASVSSAISGCGPFSFQLSLDAGRMGIRVSEFSIVPPTPVLSSAPV